MNLVHKCISEKKKDFKVQMLKWNVYDFLMYLDNFEYKYTH